MPFSTAASLGYGLHHMLHLPPQFLHPLDHRLPFGGFRPLVPSAFAPPSKCLKVETGNGAVPGNGGLPSIGSLTSMSNMFSPTSLPGAGGGAVVSVAGAAAVAAAAAAVASQEVGGPQSPAGSASRSPTGTGGAGSVPNRGATPDEEDRDANATPGSENTERSTPEEGRPYRREFTCAHIFFFSSVGYVGAGRAKGRGRSVRLPRFFLYISFSRDVAARGKCASYVDTSMRLFSL